MIGRTRVSAEPFKRVKLGESFRADTGALISESYGDWSPLNWRSSTCIDQTQPGPPYHYVGFFSVDRWEAPSYMGEGTTREQWMGPYDFTYRGKFWISYGGLTAPQLTGIARSAFMTDLAAQGVSGWSKFKPAKPIADLGVFLGESRELPRLFRDSVEALKDLVSNKKTCNMSWVANQHLATQFGWLPLMRDLEKFYEAIQKTNSWLDRVRKYNGEWEHRGGTISSGEETVPTGELLALTPPPKYAPPEGIRKGPVMVTSGYRIWFSAWFKYYIANFDSATTQLRLKTRIWGLNNTPSIVWNLLPWSWLVDWFSNVGDNIDNLLPIDGLVARMPCVMRHCWSRYEVFCSHRYKNRDGSYSTISAKQTALREVKERMGASPFGFGLTSANFSARQWSILAALGIKYY